MLDGLKAIDELTQAFSVHKINHWLFGGWAIDFHLGAVTRHHDDIDMIVWFSNTPTVIPALQQRAFALKTITPEHIYFEKYQQRIEISFIERNHEGYVVTPGRWATWPWPDDAFVAGERELHGVRCAVTSLESVLEMKRSFQAHALEQLRAKDRLDLARVDQRGG